MSSYLKKAASAVATPSQTMPLNERSIQNSAGGYSFQLDDFARLDRFLILGSEGGSYYAGEKELTIENIEAVKRCVNKDGIRTVNRIVEISKAGRAPKNDPALLALAYASAKGDLATRTAALTALPEVARIGTHLFHFISYVRQFRGWGRALRRAVENWYTSKPVEKLAEQVVKYQQRDGWSHRDLLRLRHIKFEGAYQPIAKWIVKGESSEGLPRLIEGHIKLQGTKSPVEAASLIREYGLVRESVPTELLNEKEVWAALLEKMPMTALVRNLGNLSKCGLLAPMSEASKQVVSKLKNVDDVKKSRIHPIQLLIASKTYASGHGLRGKGEWDVVPNVVDALDDAFYSSFQNVEPTGKNFYLGLDISGSMWSGDVNGIPNFPPAVATGAMALVTAKSEQNYYTAGFTSQTNSRHDTGMTPIALSSRQRLDDVLKSTKALERLMGGTDCSLPILDAYNKKLPIDTFVIYTDNETWAGNIHPAQALQQYRQKTGINAKLIVVGMTSNGFTIADPNDSGMLDVVGFDTATPNLISEFSR